MPKTKQKYDCVVIGSGPGGAPFAWKLASSGMKVLILEAGPRYNPYSSYSLNQNDFEMKGFPKKDILRNTFAKMQPLNPRFKELRSWNTARGRHIQGNERRYYKYSHIAGVGGTTLHFHGEAHRLNQNAFKTKTLYGYGVDWPIEYSDLESYYLEVEKILGVSGPVNFPDRPRKSPYPLKPHKLSYQSQLINKVCKKKRYNLIPNSVAILSEMYRGTPPCNYCNGCGWGCPRKDKGSVDVTFIPLIEDTGYGEILTGVQAGRLEIKRVGGEKKVTGVVYHDNAGTEMYVESDYVAVACGAVQTPRLLLNSGIDSNGNVGKNFMETVFCEVTALHPDRIDSYRGIPVDSIIWDWNNPNPDRGFEGGLRIFPTVGSAAGPLHYAAQYFKGWGDEYIKEVEKWFGHAMGMGGIAESIPNENSFVRLSNNEKDEYGFPVAEIQSFLGESELKSLDFMVTKIKDILSEAGVDKIVQFVTAYDLFLSTHIFGTCRMGNERKGSVVDSNLKVHGLSNLFVTDSSVFPTSGGGEAPSLTIEALSLRAGDLLVKRLKKG